MTTANATPLLDQADVFTISVDAVSGEVVTDGAVTITVDGTAVGDPLALVNGSATYTTSFKSTGAHTVSAVYTGSIDAVGSTGSVTVNVPQPSFTLTATPLATQQKGLAHRRSQLLLQADTPEHLALRFPPHR